MADQSIPSGPEGHAGSIETPATIRVGDLVPYDGVYFTVADMTTSRSGVTVLHFTDREPLLVEGPTLVYRPVEYTVTFGEIVYSR